MREVDSADVDRVRRLLLSISAVLRTAEPDDASWQIRVHELARMLERAAKVDPHKPLHELCARPPHLTVVNDL